MMGSEPRIFSPSSTSPGTVLPPNSAFWIALWVTGGMSIRRYAIALIWSARSTQAHGCDAGTA